MTQHVVTCKMVKCALLCSNVCKKCSLHANNNKGTLVMLAYNRILVVSKLHFSGNPIMNIFTKRYFFFVSQTP